MGLAYAPQSAGKGATSGNLKFYNPKLAGAYSRTGAIIQGLHFGYRFVTANYKLFTGIGAVGIGAIASGIELGIGTNETKNKFGKAYSSAQSKYNRRTKYKHSRARQCCCAIRNTHKPARRNYRNRR